MIVCAFLDVHMLVIVVAVIAEAEIAVVGVPFRFIMAVPVTMRADASVTVAVAGLVQGEGHAEHRRVDTNRVNDIYVCFLTVVCCQEWLAYFSLWLFLRKNISESS